MPTAPPATLARTLRRLTAAAVLAPAALTAAACTVLLTDARTQPGAPAMMRPLQQQAIDLAVVGAGLTAAMTLLLWWTGRRLRLRVEAVSSAARRVAQQQLPQLIRRIQRGENADIAVLPAPTGGDDPLGVLADTVARLARGAADSAFVLHRERDGFDRFTSSASVRALVAADTALRGLDRLQRHPRLEEEVKLELADVDAAATRLRRHLENLLLLAGGTVPHPHTSPLAVGNLLLDAAGETGHPARISTEFGPAAWIIPEAAGALTHLLAELLDNAVTFTHPDLPITARALPTGQGLALEVEDRGRGLRPERLDELNQRLQATPLFAQIAASEQLGMFVVGRLASQLQATVKLRPSAFGGLSVIVLLPPALLTDAPPLRTDAEPVPAAAAGTGPAPRPALVTPLPRRYSHTPVTAPAPEPPSAPAPLRPATPLPTDQHQGLGSTVDGLPQRRPGRHLAAELRGPRPAPTARPGRQVPDDRSPDAIQAQFAHFPTAKDTPR